MSSRQGAALVCVLLGSTVMTDPAASAATGSGPKVDVAHASAQMRPASPASHGTGRRTRIATAEETLNVTASRNAFRFSSAQHIADSATRISAEELINRNVVAATDLQQIVPNVTIQTMNGTSTVNYLVRGIGMNDYTQNAMPSVLTYVDGVAFPLAQMSNGMLFDLGSVDVVPGPVGTQHGQSETGGEINIQTADPTPQWHGGVSQDIASYARARSNFVLSGAL